MTLVFGSNFYANYLTRALALYRSLERHVHGDFVFYAFCMDDATTLIMRELKLRHMRVVPVELLEARDPALAEVKPGRTVAEYSWTCAPALMLYLLDQVSEGDRVAYVDADLMFFSNPQPIYDEWGDRDILIHEHRFAPRHAHFEKTSGVFNVGLVGMRKSEVARRCLERWRGQCIEMCTLDPARGLCGDQKYLDEWPGLYGDSLHILGHKGAGLAPWNVENYWLARQPRRIYVDGLPLIFYHFHAMRILRESLAGGTAIVPSTGYDFTPLQIAFLYRPYARALRAAYRLARSIPSGKVLPVNRATLTEMKQAWQSKRFLFTW